MLNYQICVYMPYLYTHQVVKMVAVFQNGGRFSKWPPKYHSSQLKCKFLK